MVVAFLAAEAMRAATSVHWGLGATVAAGVVVGTIVLLRVVIREAERAQGSAPAPTIVAVFVLIVFLGGTVSAWLSMLLYSWGIADYQPPIESQGRFIDYYLGWQVLDMIPGLDIWKTLGISPPTQPHNVAAGIPILLFRAFVLYGVFRALQQWWSRQRISH
jgi:hypothetical protein